MKDLVTKIKKARFVWIAGNGGSSATAEHLSNDLFSCGIKAICLNSNTSIMTMLANDFGYETVFASQLITYAGKEDLLITISCSGTSPNIVLAIEEAKAIGMDIHSFEIFGEEDRDYGKLEDKHLKLVHQLVKVLG